MSSWTPLIVVACLAFLAACSDGKTPSPMTPASTGVPEEYLKGEKAFNQYCAVCHGQGATGTDHGPSFIDRVYEPTHHGDAAFMIAPRTGVRAHHWNFGDMPKVAGVTDGELKQIVSYVRWLQRQAGIR